MFNFLTRRKKQTGTFSPRQEIVRLTELSPPSTLVTTDGQKDKGEVLGKAFFLRRDKKLYSEGDHIYITTPDNLKIARDQNLSSKKVSLQFFNRRVPYRIDCQIVGRYRLLPEVTETLDFSAKAAYKLFPINGLKKQDKRQFFRYTLKNYGDSRIPLTTHITFKAFLASTNKEFPEEGAPPLIFNDLKIIPFKEKEQEPHQPFATRDAINYFRDIMLKKPPHERFVHITKVHKDDSSGLVKKKDVELLLGEINILGLEMESLRDVLYLKKSAKTALTKGKKSPYGLSPGEKILANFTHDGKYYQMLMEVMESRTQNEMVRPIEFPYEEPGFATGLVNYSVGGALIESSPELLKFLLGDKCPTNVDEEPDFTDEYWKKALEELRRPMIHLTFYPKLYFPDAVRKYKPELPFKISLIAQIVRTHLNQSGDRQVLQHGLQFNYEPQGIPLQQDDIVDWRFNRSIRDNEYLQLAHSQLSSLYGYLENQSLTSNLGGTR